MPGSDSRIIFAGSGKSEEPDPEAKPDARRKQGHAANQKKEYLNWSWNYVKFCASKIELEKYYLDNKEYIINLYKNKDYPALEKVFVPYTKAMVKSLKNDEVFIPDGASAYLSGYAGSSRKDKSEEKGGEILEMKVTDYIVEFLQRKGIHDFFGYQGTMIAHLVDSIEKNPSPRSHSSYHEQDLASVWVCPGGGTVCMCLCDQRPGCCESDLEIADAYFDFFPVVFLTGQLNTYEYSGIPGLRQQGFSGD